MNNFLQHTCQNLPLWSVILQTLTSPEWLSSFSANTGQTCWELCKQIIGSHQAKKCLLACICAKYHHGIFSPFIHSVVSNDSVCGQRRPWSDCVAEETFLHGASQLKEIVFKVKLICDQTPNIFFYLFITPSPLNIWSFFFFIFTSFLQVGVSIKTQKQNGK